MDVHEPKNLAMVENEDYGRLGNGEVELALESLRKHCYEHVHIIWCGPAEDVGSYLIALTRRVLHAQWAGEKFDLSIAPGEGYWVFSLTLRAT